MQAMPATNATLLRVRRDASPVSATNDGITASGFTIVMMAMNERMTTFDSGIASQLYRVIALLIDIPDQSRARTAGHAGDRVAVAAHLQLVLARRDARLVIDHQLAAFLAHEAIDAAVAAVDVNRQLAADRLRSRDAFEGRRARDRAQTRLHALHGIGGRAELRRGGVDDRKRIAVRELEHAMQQDAGAAIAAPASCCI